MVLDVRFVVEGKEYLVQYANVAEVLKDGSLESLFNNELVEKCTVERGGSRLFGLPFMTWTRFKVTLESYLE